MAVHFVLGMGNRVHTLALDGQAVCTFWPWCGLILALAWADFGLGRSTKLKRLSNHHIENEKFRGEPHILFSEEHRRLVREGKMDESPASSCMLVATLIATVMFAAAFTIPGGNDNITGRPIFLHYRSFMALPYVMHWHCSALLLPY
ncbi:hypothetical protein LWI29_031546 [Acer saccharum]|uniref:PGG domain-containing protein n=1 Tax=Acer saccharum TaxID=4024 RepID=A0AA39RZ81_ACESA|nr:hypothetical protein LWI29_031546 [Acer saccharum]